MGLLDRMIGRKKRDERSAMGADLLYACNSGYINSNATRLSAVYRSVDVISSSVAQLPLKMFKMASDGTKTEIHNNKLLRLLNRRPDARMNRYTFMQSIVASILLRGNGYAIIERDSRGEVVNLRFIEAEKVTINRDQNNCNITYTISGEDKSYFMPSEVLHFMNITYNGIEGVSTISAATHTLEIANATDKTAKGYFTGGANLSGILTVEGAHTKSQLDTIKSSWNKTFSSVTGDSNGIAVLPGNMTFQPVSMSVADAQLIQQREYNVIEIARFFGVNPIKLFDLSKSSYSTVEATQLSFLTDTLAPLLEKMEEEIEYKLFSDDIDIKYDSNVLLRNDKASQASRLTSLTNNAIMTINEAREELELEPVEGGDKINIQVNMQQLNNTEDGAEE